MGLVSSIAVHLSGGTYHLVKFTVSSLYICAMETILSLSPDRHKVTLAFQTTHPSLNNYNCVGMHLSSQTTLGRLRQEDCELEIQSIFI